MEMIHSRSYTYIIKNVYSDPSEVFDKIVTDDRILERASSVTEAYDDFINGAQTWGNGNMWREDFRQSPSSQWEIKDLKRKLYRARCQCQYSRRHQVLCLVRLLVCIW